MVDQQTNPVTSYKVTIMNSPAAPGFLGWIGLLNKAEVAGFIYVTDSRVVPRLGSTRYVVSSVTPSLLENILYLLDNASEISIRYYDPQASGIEPNAFLETTSKSGEKHKVKFIPPFELNSEETEFVRNYASRKDHRT
jgi:hypothetical protein